MFRATSTSHRPGLEPVQAAFMRVDGISADDETKESAQAVETKGLHPRRRPKLCLVASGGGHMRQLLDLAPAWSSFDHFFVTEDTDVGRSLTGKANTYFVEHFAMGQAKLGAPGHMLMAGLKNFSQSVRLMAKERPDVVITTGAGSAFFSIVCARLLGARIVAIESLARLKTLSLFGRYVGPLAHHRVVQSEALRAFWPDAPVFDPLRILDTTPPPKRSLLFVTVGATLPFDRLVECVVALKTAGEIEEDVVIQTGVGGLRPPGIATYESLPFARMLEIVNEASIVVCHGGTGSLITALRAGCHVIAMPRRFERGEHYDDHQMEITTAFAERGLISVARTAEELGAAISRVRHEPAIVASSEPTELVAYLGHVLAAWPRSPAA